MLLSYHCFAICPSSNALIMIRGISGCLCHDQLGLCVCDGCFLSCLFARTVKELSFVTLFNHILLNLNGMVYLYANQK